MYELLAQLAKYLIIGLLYYLLYNFLKIMIMDIREYDQEGPGYFLQTEEGKEIPLLKVTTIGRAVDSDIVIDDPYLSSKHALIYKKGNSLYIQDLKSTNGTFLNGVKIRKPVKLKENDVLVLGSKKYILKRRELNEPSD
ncbi:FHA domain-containing protein FhaB [Thermovenabulum gondwanense]|uniref:FHA domain-containing protein FhaB n=1 Tax=Thermovenabulum gondwanense TaxID=520767 RepID=A0A161PZ41_9FIRM|nr:FHA domain-containing protein FhaB [Thermovenabulum gondwanense]